LSADFRYMKCPRQTWFFVYNIPPDLRGHPRLVTATGKPMDKITESLGTKDPDKAREVRNQRIVYWDRQFRVLRHGPTADDIREEAVEVYRAALKAEAERPKKFGSLAAEFAVEGYPHRLDLAISIQAAAEIADYCKRTGQVLQPETEPYRKIGVEFIKAKVAAKVRGAWLPLPDGREVRGDEQDLPRVEPPIPSEPKPIIDPPPPKKTAETFSEAFEKYLDTELDGTRAETIAEYRRKVRMFTEKVGDLPLGKISDRMAVDFLDDYLLGERKVSPRTRNLYCTLFSAVFKCAIRRKKVTANSFGDQRVKAATVHYDPFNDQEIATLFADAKLEIAPSEYSSSTALPWVSLIAAYTGCRREEVAQLKAADIKQTDGIWYFEFCHDGNGKTEAATRVVPLHRALIKAGLIRYRDALPKGSMLFPGLKGRKSKGGKLGPKLGDAFNGWRKRLGIDRPRVNFHSFRHSVGDRLRKAGVQESDIAAVLGHEDERITSRVYGHDGPGLRRLKAVVEKLRYPGLAEKLRHRRPAASR
jgi:integrase